MPYADLDVAREHRREWMRRWRRANPEKVAAASKAYREKHPEYHRDWQRKNKAPAKTREKNQRQYANNKATYVAKALAREEHIKQRTPTWADLGAIAAVYAVAQAWREAGIAVHVDHMLPLRGKRVSGLHVVENLRIVPAKENLAKGNAYEPA